MFQFDICIMQALRDPSADWVACELRFDRAARCFQRFALRGLSQAGNAGLIVGDARMALEKRLMPGRACGPVSAKNAQGSDRGTAKQAIDITLCIMNALPFNPFFSP